ncbi:hypothetical protein [Haloferax sp. DFSO52]|uniref:DUF7344 domain-containing protein n=1 Tax=Haloferax sp. DFSO52 TaxID=3388505 RepID=UPI003A8C6FFA
MNAKRPSKRRHTSTDEIFHLLGDRRRRTLLTEFGSTTDSITLFALADRLSQSETNHEGTLDTDILVTLHHVDLPKLDNAGLLTYDPSHQVVRFDSAAVDLGTALEDVESVLESMRNAL